MSPNCITWCIDSWLALLMSEAVCSEFGGVGHFYHFAYRLLGTSIMFIFILIPKSKCMLLQGSVYFKLK
jgi:ABC-type nitrate/sulfonate/bicarbonate transport system permease component